MNQRAPFPILAVGGLLVLACSGSPRADIPTNGKDPLVGPGQAFYWSGEYDSAHAAWEAALSRARVDGDSSGVANVLTWLGLVAMRTGDYAESRRLGQAALSMKLDLGATAGLARSYNALGLLAKIEDRLPDAQRLFEHARRSAVAAGERDLEGSATGNLGLVLAYLGDLEGAAAMLEQMRGVGESTGDHRLKANALTNLAMVSIWAGDPQTALAPLDTARALYRELGNALGEQIALGQLATARSAMGQYEPALAALDSALALARRHSMRDQEAENLGLLGGIYADLGDGRRALRDLDQAAALASEIGLNAMLGNVLRRAALVRYAMGSHDRALADATAALEAHRAADQPFEEIDDLLVLAELHRRSGNQEGSSSMLRQARILAHQVDARSARSAVALAEARHAEQAGAPLSVLRAIARVHEDAPEADYRTRTESHMLAARAYVALERLDSAGLETAQALHALDRMRAGIASVELRSSFAAASAGTYGDAVLILLRLGRVEEAFTVADAGRSRDLLQRLTMVRTPHGSPTVGEDRAMGAQDLAGMELLLRRIDALLSQLRDMESAPPLERGAGAASTAADILGRIDRLREEYEALAMRTVQHHPRSAAMLGAVRTDGAAVRGAIAPDEVILHYTLTENEVVVFVLRHDRFESLRLPIDASDLASRIRLLRELWSDRDAPPAVGLPAARGLHELLIGPVARAGMLDRSTRLIIVPHGVLEQLPFAALQDPESYRFLVEDYVISYLHSANLLPAIRTGAAPSAGSRHGITAFAPFQSALPGTRAEAVLASRSSSRGALHLDRRATERAVRRALEDSEVVHIASHGILNARNPMFSRIELARGAGGSSTDDGRLEVHEVLKLTVNSALVVLSGCETGVAEDWSGNPLRPAGVATLGQAFLHAGARNVMATLWRIDDLGSADLVGQFYHHLGDGDVAGALAAAQRALIRDARYASPYYWAGFVVMGDGQVRRSAQESLALSVQ
jgi:CHAT domain-containing protein/tetratricopeptide (TPR) repeat protein